MLLLSKKPPATEVFAWCEQWLAHLSAGDYLAAHAMIVPDSQWNWTPKLIEELIANYGTLDPDSTGHRYHVTPPETAIGKVYLDGLRVDPNDPVLNMTGEVHPRFPFAIVWYRKPGGRAVGEVHIDYPLDGEWSNLSSTFDVLPWDERLALDLERIEVM